MRILVFGALIALVGQIACFAQDAKLSDPIIGTADISGEMALHVFTPGAKNPRVVRLCTDYGVVMCHNRDGDALFVLGNRTKKTVTEFSNYNDFLEALGELPPQSIITIYDRCTVPLFYDFYPVHAELSKKFKTDCAKRKLRIAQDPKLVCTCDDDSR